MTVSLDDASCRYCVVTVGTRLDYGTCNRCGTTETIVIQKQHYDCRVPCASSTNWRRQRWASRSPKKDLNAWRAQTTVPLSPRCETAGGGNDRTYFASFASSTYANPTERLPSAKLEHFSVHSLLFHFNLYCRRVVSHRNTWKCCRKLGAVPMT